MTAEATVITANTQKGKPRAPGRRGRKGLWILAAAAVSLAVVMGLMMASSDQTPYGATQVWSAEPTGTVGSKTLGVMGSHLPGAHAHGQETENLPASTLIHVGAQ